MFIYYIENKDIWNKCVGIGISGAIRSADPRKG